MQNCENCKIILDNDVKFCPNCGNNVAESSATSKDKEVRLAALLTSANLHRVRREWDAAIADATEALRIAPDRAEVASLLANIYEQRGDLDEAAVWYRIALDLDPQNTADQTRLERVVSLISSRNASKKKNFSRELIIAVLVSLFVILVSVILFLNLRGTHREAPRKIEVRAAKEPKRTPIRSVTSEPNQTKNKEQQLISTTSLAGYGQIPVLRTAAEIAIREAAASMPLTQSTGVKIDDVIADPRAGTVIITFSVPFKATLTKADIISVAAAVARAAFVQNAEVQKVVARCVTSTNVKTGAMILFVGDTSRSVLTSLSENATWQQVQQAFTNVWWNPYIVSSD